MRVPGIAAAETASMLRSHGIANVCKSSLRQQDRRRRARTVVVTATETTLVALRSETSARAAYTMCAHDGDMVLKPVLVRWCGRRAGRPHTGVLFTHLLAYCPCRMELKREGRPLFLKGAPFRWILLF